MLRVVLRTRSGSRRLVGLAATAAVAASLFVAVPPAIQSANADPPNPTNQDLRNTKNERDKLVNDVGVIAGQIAVADQQLQTSQNRAALAEQKVALAVSQERDAKEKSRQADAAQARAADELAAARRKQEGEQKQFAQYMQAIYMSGDPDGLTGSLLTSPDPNALLQKSTLEQYEVQHRAGIIGSMQRASIEVSNKSAKAKGAANEARDRKLAAQAATKRSIEAQQAAIAAVQDDRATEARLVTYKAGKQRELDAKRTELASKLGQRAAYNAFIELKRQREIARQKRLAEIARQQRLAEIERQKREAAQQGSSYHPPAPRPAPSAPSSGGWTQSKGYDAVRRAKSTLGTPYAWAGGGPGGPSYGACVPSAGAPYDCNVYGYDCSGLAMFAWGKGWDHYAATQYTQAGSYHPGTGDLRPGDLVFYSNGGIGGIHHVAIYAGGGQIIEAPYSGGYVQYNSVFAYSDYFGATRPLT